MNGCVPPPAPSVEAEGEQGSDAGGRHADTARRAGSGTAQRRTLLPARSHRPDLHSIALPADGPPLGGARPPRVRTRGRPRGAAFSWYTYSPTRVRHPYVRGVLLELYREALARSGDPVLAWAGIQSDPERRRSCRRTPGKGGLVRASWDEAVEIVAAAHVHPIKTHGPDRIAGFSAPPQGCSLDYEGDPGAGGDGPFRQDSGRRRLPLVPVENFHALRRRRTTDETKEI